MGWRDRKINELVTKYRSDSSVTRLSEVKVEMPKVYQNKPATLTLSSVAQTQEAQISFTNRHQIPVTILHKKAVIETIVFQPISQNPQLFPDDSIVISKVSFDKFQVNVTRFSFQSERQERQPLLPKITETSIVHRVCKRIKFPTKPPSFRTVSLEERLRWLLTPPIQEVLSDPLLALPERPFPFQAYGIKWLYDRDNALLADEMGLGKTMQAIIAARLLWRARNINQILIVCPKTLIPTWQNEIRKWWPQVGSSVMLAGSDRQFFLRLGTPNVIIKIINYASLAREAEWLKEQRFSHDLVIIDEAQRIKSSQAKTSKAVKALNAHKRWALTGTPLENKVDDVISIFDFVRPGLFLNEQGEWSWEYMATYKSLRLTENQEVENISSMIRPYILRRRAEEVIDELPDKSEQEIEIELDDKQRETYNRMEQEGVIDLNAKGDTITVTHVFALINKLRQICNFDPITGSSAKLERLLEDLEEVSESKRKALIFSQFVSEDAGGLKRLAKELQDKELCVLQFHGQVPENQRSEVIQTFESDKDCLALLLNFKVGGIGLNLQVANYVFLFDRWWNPAVEDQAVKRVHRIGQTHKVFIRRFYCKNTIEERILKKLEEKKRLFQNIIDEARPDPESMGLTEEEIFSLFNITVRPHKLSEKKGPKRVIVENMDPTQFEVMVAELYEKQGYAVRHLGRSHDEGIDILAERTNAGGLEKIVIQCKHQQANVGRPVIQQLWGVITSDPSYTRGDLVTSSGFTSEAKQFASGKRLSLIDSILLSKLVQEFGVARFEHPSA
jgi:superfamily II DNA or RNA helicase/HJR/Mrr/RecB family endonuclease